MIETEQTIVIDAAIGDVWSYARDMQRWASIMPGYQECQIVDDENSLWVLKIGVGGLVRTVKVQVRVDRWAGPDAVDFTFALQGDPVNGGGAYRARALSPSQTEVVLTVQVNGSGPMAPMWEAMGGPVLPKFARGFAEQLKAMIEQAFAAPGAPAPAEPVARPSLLARLLAWLRRLLG